MSWGRLVYEEETPWTWPESESASPNDNDTARSVEAAASYVSYAGGLFTGEQYFAGLGGLVDEVDGLDYWELRRRSAALFYTNVQAQGIAERFVTNVIHTGIEVECTPEAQLLGFDTDDALTDWTETIENRYRLFQRSKSIIDAKGTRTEGDLQKQIYREALVEGDCLVICRIDSVSELPQLQIVPGNRIQTPPEKSMDSTIVDGVKRDKKGRHLGYWVYQGTNHVVDDRYVYVPAIGPSSGRRTAWMVYSPVKREDDVRGQPLLSVVIQGLKDSGDYRKYTILKAKMAATVFGQTVREAQPSLPGKTLAGKSLRAESHNTDPANTSRQSTFAYMGGGFVKEDNDPGEELKLFTPSGSDVNYGPFETAIINGIAWGLHCPPEILTLSFNSNYSASQAARDEWWGYLILERFRFSGEHNQNLFEEWFIAELLLGKFQAGKFLEACRDPRRYDEKQAWLSTEWYGTVKPHMDRVKQMNAYKMAFSEGLNTRSRAARESTGMKFSKITARLAKENQMLADTMVPFLEIKQKYGEQAVNDVMSALGIGSYDAEDTVKEEAAA